MSHPPQVSANVIQNMRALRKRRGWTAADFAQVLQATGSDTTFNVLANLESGRRASVTVDELFAFARALNVPIERLTEGPQCRACKDVPPAGFACLTCGKAAE